MSSGLDKVKKPLMYRLRVLEDKRHQRKWIRTTTTTTTLITIYDYTHTKAEAGRTFRWIM
jgi:hypothetical protein